MPKDPLLSDVGTSEQRKSMRYVQVISMFGTMKLLKLCQGGNGPEDYKENIE